ncbi:MAG TPA: SRPBCC domain-containing protein [Streptosporangiaceae bacterium]
MTAENVTATVHIDAPPERVWEYFTKPGALLEWMGEYAILEPEPGGEFTVNVKGAPVRGRFLHLDPPRRLLISWGYAGSDRLPPGASTVEIRLTPDGAGTRVDLEHRELPPAEEPGHVIGWAHYLARLTAAAVGDAGPDPGMGPISPAQTKQR